VIGPNMNAPMMSGASINMRYTGLPSTTPMGQKPSWQNDIDAMDDTTNTSATTRAAVPRPAAGPHMSSFSDRLAFAPAIKDLPSIEQGPALALTS